MESLVELAFRYRESNGSDNVEDYLWDYCPPEPSLSQGHDGKYHNFISNVEKLGAHLELVLGDIWKQYELTFETIPAETKSIKVIKVGAEDTCLESV